MRLRVLQIDSLVPPEWGFTDTSLIILLSDSVRN